MPSAARLALLLTSPRVAPGLLSRSAWAVLDAADVVLVGDEDAPPALALRDAGITVEVSSGRPPGVLARELLDRARTGTVVWVGSADGDPGLSDALALEAARRPDPAELEVVVGSWDVPGARLLDAVAVMDRLRSPGGCPWDAEQTHTSLVPYLLEEAHEAVEAIESGDREHLREELGDVLLQVLFHARVAAEHSEQPFDVDDVAAGLVDKLVRRHPHVFADAEAADPAAVEAGWARIKAAEKPHRQHPLDGIPVGMPELARAATVVSRLERAGLGDWLVAHLDRPGLTQDTGAAVLRLVVQAQQEGIDPAAALRATLRSVADAVHPAGGGSVTSASRAED